MAWGQNGGKGGAMFCLPPNEFVFIFGIFDVCPNFGENPSRNAIVRVRSPVEDTEHENLLNSKYVLKTLSTYLEFKKISFSVSSTAGSVL